MTKKIFILLAFLPQITWAWGTVGHRTIGTVAEKLLTPEVKIQLQKYLQPHESLADVANWADTLKAKPSQWGHTNNYHFEQVSDDQTYLESIKSKPEEERKKGGTLQALLEAQRVFLSSASTGIEKTDALKFLIHFIGDIHQPLHSGRPEDNGGNKIPINWNGDHTNLHAVWDSHLINQAYLLATQDKNPKQVSDETYAEFLIEKFADSPAPGKWGDFRGWLDEAMALRHDAYLYKDESEALYTHRFIDVVDRQVYKAGVRLAEFLTRLAKGKPQTSAQLSLKAAIESITGPLKKFIFLRPQGQQALEEESLLSPALNDESCNPFSAWTTFRQ